MSDQPYLFGDARHQEPPRRVRTPSRGGSVDMDAVIAFCRSALDELPTGFTMRIGSGLRYLVKDDKTKALHKGVCPHTDEDLEAAMRLLHHDGEVRWLGGRCYTALKGVSA